MIGAIGPIAVTGLVTLPVTTVIDLKTLQKIIETASRIRRVIGMLTGLYHRVTEEKNDHGAKKNRDRRKVKDRGVQIEKMSLKILSHLMMSILLQPIPNAQPQGHSLLQEITTSFNEFSNLNVSFRTAEIPVTEIESYSECARKFAGLCPAFRVK